MLLSQMESSFRDTSGYVFKDANDEIYRKINFAYKKDYDLLMSSGLYEKLIQKGLLIKHEEIDFEFEKNVYKTIKPELIKFISYPYEWSFSQIKDAALLTLEIQEIALKYSMILKDASAYNIQFHKGKPVFIDTLSFEQYESNKPWIAYRQFCQHFLNPLLLMKFSDISLNQLYVTNIDGVSSQLTWKLLSLKGKLNLNSFMHVYLQAISESKLGSGNKKIEINMPKFQLLAMIDNLKRFIQKLTPPCCKTEWGEYYTFTNYSNTAANCKKELIFDFIKEVNPKQLCDLGANDGSYSRIASDAGIETISLDIDPIAVEKNYNYTKKNNVENILPLLANLCNLSPAIGWNNKERLSLKNRLNSDIVMVLALIHHLCISNNIPFNLLFEFLNSITKRYLIIEFIPKEDDKVQKLLLNRKDIFENYIQENFEYEFEKYFNLIKKSTIKDSLRTLYFGEKKQ